MKTPTNPIRLIAAVLALALLGACLTLFWPGSEHKRLVADFPRTVSLYEGSDVKILGVPVGKVEKVTPAGTKVRVEIRYDSEQDLPADVKAVVISPSIVGDRFVQLTPAYTGGKALADNAELGVERTATPLELDEIFSSLNDLNLALGPDGANAPGESGVGALTRILDSTARNFGGQGVEFNKTVKDLGRFTGTLANNKDELFGSLAELERVIGTLAEGDQTVRSFNDSLASGAKLLADEREELAAALRNLGVALTAVRGFVQDNKALLSSNIKGLNRLSTTLVKQRDALDQTLKVAPAALNNLYLAGNPTTGTLDTRANLGENVHALTTDPKQVLCGLGGKQVCDLLETALPRPGTGAAADLSGRRTDVETVDRTLAGLVAAP